MYTLLDIPMCMCACVCKYKGFFGAIVYSFVLHSRMLRDSVRILFVFLVFLLFHCTWLFEL